MYPNLIRLRMLVKLSYYHIILLIRTNYISLSHPILIRLRVLVKLFAIDKCYEVNLGKH